MPNRPLFDFIYPPEIRDEFAERARILVAGDLKNRLWLTALRLFARRRLNALNSEELINCATQLLAVQIEIDADRISGHKSR